MSLVLSKAEIRNLTGKVHREAQLRELAFLGIEATVRSDGSLVVYRADLRRENAPERPREPQLRLS